jgi:hypothetical protein
MNTHLRSYMKGLTAKVFRTYNASTTFEKELLSVEFKPGTIQQEKVNAYNKANKTAAELCNHQRAPPKTHTANMAKMSLQVSLSIIRSNLEKILMSRLVDWVLEAPEDGHASSAFP